MAETHETSCNNVRTVSNAQLEAALADWVREIWRNCVYVNDTLIQEKPQCLNIEFDRSENWIYQAYTSVQVGFISLNSSLNS